ncbi:MAG: peptide chain release factor 1 [Clostridia bacterium]|nr:peptide chain release factor 1 [Clostridia bacterium]MBR2397379.1 peptide chain release factor 1 [Clostridia bacterium]MBR2874318.1 peptide chain release factor 1 [Clostridia bacterium]
MFDKVEKLKDKFIDLEKQLSDMAVISDRKTYAKLTKEHANLQPIVAKYDEYKGVIKSLEDTLTEIDQTSDAEMLELLREEIKELKDAKENAEQELKILLLPKDPNDDRNVVVEVRAGAGGEEAALFASRLVRMYQMYADKHRFQMEIIDENLTELGGVKEMVFNIIGQGAYSRLKYESGVHRVQRVPETESQGRIHTSTATVAVLPEADDIDVEILEKDLKIDRYRSGGAGGQHVNKTESAIRITHLPTGIIVECQDERSQIKNLDKAMKVLKTRLYDHFNQIAEKEQTSQRRSQVGTGDRSERIRTYNYPQGRITDHRIGYTSYDLPNYLNGNLDDMINALAIADQNAKLQAED